VARCADYRPSPTHAQHHPSQQLPTPAVSIAISTSCGPGLGMATSCRVKADGGPNRLTAAAFIVSGIAKGVPSIVRKIRR
jgi:hypothetical protein